MALSYAFGGNTGLSYEDLQRRRMFAEGLMQRGMSSQPKTAMEGLNSAASSIMGALLSKKLSGEEAKGREAASSVFRDLIAGRAGGMGGYGGMPATPADPNPNAPQSIADDTMRALGKAPIAPEGWNAIRNGIFAGESGGDYNALFGFSNRPGGAFSGTNLTDMTVDQALAFADPSGPYGQHVKGQIGRVATPMGAYQVVGTTLRGAKEGMGLTGSEKMTPELQDRIGQWIYKTQGTGAWEGYRGPQSGGGQSAPVSPMDLPALAAFAANPYADPGQKAVAQALLNQQMQAFDPSYQMGLEKQRLELDALRHPQAKPANLTTFTGPDGTVYSFNPMTGQKQAMTGAKPVDTKPTDDIREYEFAKSQGYQGSFTDYQSEMSKSGAKSGYGLNPQYGVDANGNPVILQLGSDGTAVQTKLPEGVTFQKQPIKVDAGTEFILLDPISRQPVGRVPKDLYGAEAQKAAGKAAGEDTASLESLSSKMEGLNAVVDQLGKLANDATYTYAGRAVDETRKQLGMAPRDSAVARAQYTAMVDNQVLPLLRDTFGAQFTQNEGETLRATLGDPDKSPAEKQAVLKAFIEQKRRDVEALQLRTGQGGATPKTTYTWNPETGELE